MAFKIYTIAGNTQNVLTLRLEIKQALEKHSMVEVYLLQPGIMYEENNEWKTVIDFINEWAGEPISFFSNLVPLKDTVVPVTYTNDMFFAGHQLYKKNKRCKSLLSLLDPIKKDRSYFWDLLLGESRPNRDLLHSMAATHPIGPKLFMTYFKHDVAGGHWGEHVVRPNQHSAETLNGPDDRYNSQIRCSDLIDPEIYNQTYYTAMIETVIHKDFAMFSEKEAKPIIAKRPFVIFGSPGHLRAFRKLGFKSFSPVIDESYDDELDLKKRFSMCLDAMHKLCDNDPLVIHARLADVLAHNKKHFEDSNWQRCVSFDKDL